MIRLQGIAVSPGIAIGKVLVFDSGGFQIAKINCLKEQAPAELARFEEALQVTYEDIRLSSETVTAKLGGEYGAIFEAHLALLHDRKLLKKIRDAITEDHLVAESAVNEVFREYIRFFQGLGDEYLAERSNDMIDLGRRILHALRHEKKLPAQVSEKVILLANELTPSETVSMDKEMIQALVTERGGPSSHTAIVAEAMQIPAVVGVGEFLDRVSAGDQVIVDGNHGLIILDPDEATIRYYAYLEAQQQSIDDQLKMLRDESATTLDGVEIQLLGNIEFPAEAETCLEYGASGIGLYRTEFLYLSGGFPDEEEHYQAYRHVVETMNGRPVTIRTVDLGADKLLEHKVARPSSKDYYVEGEKNPGLGLRSIRLSLKRIELFRRQLRAIFRVSAIHPVKIMFPLVSTLTELRQAKMIVEDVKEDLREENIPYSDKVEIGIMVEVPSTVLMIDQFVSEVDFLSIGTNDLTQYTLAVDRTNREVVHLFNSCDPAILKLIVMTLEGAKKKGVPVSLCGQMSGNPLYTMLLLGLGLRTLSIAPRNIPEVKNICRGVNITHCKALARRVLLMERAGEIKGYLKSELRKLFPDPDDLLD
ncbi:MAG: phosphoenolpyruvate--protein phosphotransferase [Planctomycetia bacterium]|nr:phosphoenolpyruvate--protein phosphotransferase [Planctomycetia bacterium]